MKKITLLTVVLTISLFISSFGYSKNRMILENNTTLLSVHSNFMSKAILSPINSAVLADFFKKYPDLKKYQEQVSALYKKRSYNSIWYQNDKINEFGFLLYQKLNSTYEEGVDIKMPYIDKIDQVFDESATKKISESDTEIMLTSMYIIYAKKIYEGLDDQTVKKTGWFLPKKKISYDGVLDSIMANPNLLSKNDEVLFYQYYRLQEVLKKYRQIEKDNTWTIITTDSPYKDLRPDDSSKTIGQVRHRLFVIGDIKNDSKSNKYDQELMDGVMIYKLRYGLTPNYILTEDHIKQMNESIGNRIKTLMLNMERCRWIPPSLTKADEYVMVNIPSFRLFFVKNGKYDLVSEVFVGTELTKTIIFSGKIDRIVFSPYWYVPQSIIKNELKSQMAENKNYLAEHNMEWNNGQVRQKPGPNNSLGLVKFLFPNPNDIYLHDTPAKSLFQFEKRTFSHGCINVKKAKDLAIAILKDNPEWPIDKINQAMDGTKETPYILPKKIPIYIGYFTAWVDEKGNVSFFQDVYDRDANLDKILFPQDTTFNQ